jgi:hypothetical protein
MIHISVTRIAILALTLVSVGCGGGNSGDNLTPIGSSSTIKISGVVAVGAALSGARVSAKCSNGETYQGITDSTGAYSIPLASNGGDPAPCMLKAEGTSDVLYSYAQNSGVININPLTDLTLAKALAGSAPQIFDNFKAGLTIAQQTSIADAGLFMQSVMDAVAGYKSKVYNSEGNWPDAFTFNFKLGDERDKLFDAFSASLKVSNISYETFRNKVIENSSFREGLASKLWAFANSKIIPTVSSFACEISTNKNITCTLKGKNLSYPKQGGINRADLGGWFGMSISQNSKHPAIKSPPNRPYSSDFCNLTASSLGVSARSLDSADPLGPDPTGSFAEEVTFTCSVPINVSGSLTAELFVSDPWNQDVIVGNTFGNFSASIGVPIPQPPTSPSFSVDIGNAVVTISNVNCNASSNPTNISITGNVALPAAASLVGVITNNPRNADEYVSGTSATTFIFTSISDTAGGGSTVGFTCNRVEECGNPTLLNVNTDYVASSTAFGFLPGKTYHLYVAAVGVRDFDSPVFDLVVLSSRYRSFVCI